MSPDKINIFSKFFQYLRLALFGPEQEYTSGSIRKAVFMLSIPMIAEMMMEGLFAIIDIIFVMKIGVNAVATVGLTEAVVTLIYALAIGLSMATTAVVARRVGERKPNEASVAGAQAIIVGTIVSIILAILGILFPKEILRLMGAESLLIEEGYRFTQILIGGNLSIMLIFLINAIFRGAGNAKIAMKALGLASLLNIILDPIFIFGLGPIPAYGVTGAAIATTIGRSVAVIYQLYMLQSGKSIIKIDLKVLKIKFDVMINLIKLSLGGIGQFLIGTSSWMFLMRIVSEFGSEVLAGYVLSIRIIMFTMLPAWGMSNAAATLVGQNLGAGKPDRAEQSVWKTAKYNVFFMLFISIIYITFANQLVGFFTEDKSVVYYASLSLRLISSGYIFYGFGMVITQAFNGAGDTKTPTLINLVCFWVFQLPLAYFAALEFGYGPSAVFLSVALAESMLAIMAIYLFRKGKWKKINI